MRARLGRLAARPARSRLASWFAAWAAPRLRLGLMPFRAARRLEPRERWLVVCVWAALGGLAGCAWLALLAALLPGLRLGSGWLLLVVLLLGAIAFFAAAAYLVTGIGNRLIVPPRDTQVR